MENVPNRVVKWKINKLRDHPRQAELFGDLSEPELVALAEDMKANMLRDPILILPNGTIICGHQRVRAARLLGWLEIEAVVRTDLEAAGEAAIETLFLSDNLLRRHLSPLARAKCIKELVELE